MVPGILFCDSGERRGKKNHSTEGNFIGQSKMAVEFVGGISIFLNELVFLEAGSVCMIEKLLKKFQKSHKKWLLF